MRTPCHTQTPRGMNARASARYATSPAGRPRDFWRLARAAAARAGDLWPRDERRHPRSASSSAHAVRARAHAAATGSAPAAARLEALDRHAADRRRRTRHRVERCLRAPQAFFRTTSSGRQEAADGHDARAFGAVLTSVGASSGNCSYAVERFKRARGVAASSAAVSAVRLVRRSSVFVTRIGDTRAATDPVAQTRRGNSCSGPLVGSRRTRRRSAAWQPQSSMRWPAGDGGTCSEPGGCVPLACPSKPLQSAPSRLRRRRMPRPTRQATASPTANVGSASN